MTALPPSTPTNPLSGPTSTPLPMDQRPIIKIGNKTYRINMVRIKAGAQADLIYKPEDLGLKNLSKLAKQCEEIFKKTPALPDSKHYSLHFEKKPVASNVSNKLVGVVKNITRTSNLTLSKITSDAGGIIQNPDPEAIKKHVSKVDNLTKDLFKKPAKTAVLPAPSPLPAEASSAPTRVKALPSPTLQHRVQPSKKTPIQQKVNTITEKNRKLSAKQQKKLRAQAKAGAPRANALGGPSNRIFEVVDLELIESEVEKPTAPQKPRPAQGALPSVSAENEFNYIEEINLATIRDGVARIHQMSEEEINELEQQITDFVEAHPAEAPEKIIAILRDNQSDIDAEILLKYGKTAESAYLFATYAIAVLLNPGSIRAEIDKAEKQKEEEKIKAQQSEIRGAQIDKAVEDIQKPKKP